MNKYSDNALAIYKRLYFDEKQNESNPSDVHHRVANFLSFNGVEQDIFIKLLENNVFRPNSPCLINAGRKSDKPHDKQLCACFVLGLEDSMESIINMWGICAKIYASGAGAGIPITNLREYQSPISSGGTASGPLRYLKVVDLLSDTVRSGGRTRRAANIGIFKYNHPETMQIINSKSNGQEKLTSFNLSMAVTNEFMDLLEDEEAQFTIVSPNKNEHKGEIYVQDLWKEVINNAWTCGDPGLLFIDRVNQFNPLPSLGAIESTNPCGEIPLPPWSVCNIGSMNLNKFVRTNPGMATCDFKPFFKWEEFRTAIEQCVHFLDNVIDKTTYLHPKFENMSKATRPIGLGFMGFADILVKLGIPYGSEESIDLFEKICFELNYTAIKKSIDLVIEGKRSSIPIPDTDKDHFLKLINYYTKGDSDLLNKVSKYGIRNSTWTCIAPTGSISMSADASYAWEPIMALVWEKQLTDTNEILTIIHPEFEKVLNETFQYPSGLTKEKIIKDIIKNNGSIQNLDYFNEKFKKIFRVAHDIDPYDKIRMQGVGQKWISLAISSTCNLPHSATKEDVDNIYKHAFKCGLKGITIFRDGCLNKQIVNFGEIKKEPKKERPIKRSGETVEISTPYGKMFITCNFNSEKPFEIFFRVGKQGALTNVLIDALGRVCSKALQGGIPMDVIIDTLRGLKGEKFWFKIADDIDKAESAESIIDAIALLIDHHWTNKSNEQCVDDNCELDRCPQCHRKTLRRDTGCKGGMCTACDYSSCG